MKASEAALIRLNYPGVGFRDPKFHSGKEPCDGVAGEAKDIPPEYADVPKAEVVVKEFREKIEADAAKLKKSNPSVKEIETAVAAAAGKEKAGGSKWPNVEPTNEDKVK